MNQNNNSIDDDKALTAIAGVAESIVAETTVERNTGISTTTMDVDDASSLPADDMVTVPVEATAMTVIVAENINIGTNIEKSPEEEAIHETVIATTTTTTAPEGEDIAVTATTTNVQTTNDDIDDAMVESESNAISLASTALLIDLERRYMDMSTDYQRLKVELHHAQSQIQQQQLSSTTEPNVTLQNSLNAKEEQIVQLQNQIQTQQETFRLVQEQKDQLQANHDTLQEDMRYGHLFLLGCFDVYHIFWKNLSFTLAHLTNYLWAVFFSPISRITTLPYPNDLIHVVVI